ncbi:MAG: hypothetical protein CSA96_08095 [Bacteroidetes bacterium]|nr:MAG: hypothetical protein CSA96_08095 [Bacteroidota bacterium]
MRRDRQDLLSYLDDELLHSESKDFRQELAEDPEFLADPGLHRELDEMLADSEVLDFRDQLGELRSGRRNRRQSKIFRLNRPWHYAASAAAAFLVAFGLAAVLGRPLSNKDLFLKYMKPYELVLTNRSADNDLIDGLMNLASEAFLAGDYQQAVIYYDEILKLNSAKVEADFHRGISKMELEEYRTASKSFEKVIRHNDNLYISKAEWYLSACLLAMDETERARRQLSLIASSPSHYYRKDANKVLKRMKR